MFYEPIQWGTEFLVALIFRLKNDDQKNCHSDVQDFVLLGGHLNLLDTRESSYKFGVRICIFNPVFL